MNIERRRAAAKAVSVVALAFGLFVFWFMAAVDFTLHVDCAPYEGCLWASSILQDPVLSSIFHALAMQYVRGRPLSGMGPSGFAGFCAACLGFLSLRWEIGPRRALRQTASWFAAPTLVAFELVLWHTQPSQMLNHATDFISSEVGKVYLLPNYSVLAVAASVLLLDAKGVVSAARHVTRKEALLLACIVFGAAAVAAVVAVTVHSPHVLVPVYPHTAPGAKGV